MSKKSFFTIALLLLLSIISLGQTGSASPKWTVSTILLNEPNKYMLSASFQPNVLTGMTIKYHFKLFTARIGAEYVKNIDKPDEPECCDLIYSEGYGTELLIRAGLEKGYTFKKHYRPYLVLDFARTSAFSDHIYTGGFSGNINQRSVIKSTSIGAMPAFGFEYIVNKSLSLSLESRIRMFYTKSTEEMTGISGGYPLLIIKETKNQKTFNRIGALSLNLSF